jgi:hypothetical protein
VSVSVSVSKSQNQVNFFLPNAKPQGDGPGRLKTKVVFKGIFEPGTLGMIAAQRFGSDSRIRHLQSLQGVV